jgi:hypothetical protein
MKLMGNIEVHNVSSEQEKFLRAREVFSQKYMHERGWTIESISITQLMEIRAQEGWKNPHVDSKTN